jgi:hypothetical protein
MIFGCAHVMDEDSKQKILVYIDVNRLIDLVALSGRADEGPAIVERIDKIHDLRGCNTSLAFNQIY